MSSYKSSRATPNTTTESRYNPLNNTNATFNPKTNETNNNNNNSNSDSDLSSHPSYFMHKTNTILPPIYTTHTLNKKRIIPPQPQQPSQTQIKNTNESTKWNFGGIIQSVWSNVIKPTISNDNNSSQPITPITHP
eukprot:999023_1